MNMLARRNSRGFGRGDFGPRRACSWGDSQLTCRAPARALAIFRSNFSISADFAFRTGCDVRRHDRDRAAARSKRFVFVSVVAKPHFPWTKIVISSDEKRRSSRSLPGPFAAEQPTDASYLSRVVRCAPASDEAPRGPNWQSINRRTRRPKFHDERPATPRCLLALPTEASSFP